MGLKAAGKYPATWHNRGGRTPLYFLARRARGWDDAYQLERGILAAVAMGRIPYSFGGRNLVARAACPDPIRERPHRPATRTRPTGACWRCGARSRSPVPVGPWPTSGRTQWENGGFGYARGGAPDSNDTAAALMALRAAARRAAGRS